MADPLGQTPSQQLPDPLAPPIQPSQNPPPQSPPEFVPPDELSPEPGKKSRAWVWVVILLLVLLIPAGLIFATEQGFINIGLDKYYNAIGLEKLWAGLPVDAQKALLKVAPKMQSLKTYHFAGTLDLLGNVSTEDAASITQKIPLLSEGKILGQEASELSATVDFAGDYQSPDKVSATMSLNLGSEGLGSLPIQGPLNIDLRLTNNKFYFKIPSLSVLVGEASNKWFVVDQGQYQTQSQEYTEKLKPEAYKEGIKSSQRLPSESVKGKMAYRYQIVIDKNKLFTSTSSADYGSIEDPKVDIYIGKKDKLIYKIKIETGFEQVNSKASIKADLSFSDFNKPVDIKAPKDEEIAKEGVLGLLNSLKISGLSLNQPGTADAKRKIDLAQIKSALTQYKKDNNSYPVSSDIDKTNNPSGVLSKALVPKYISKLPIDPKDPTSWYGYKSDGTTFTLWCLLDDKTDSAGKQEGQYFKYIVTND